MNADVFIDTNVLVYAAIGTGKEKPKGRRAVALIKSGNFGTSAQVLQEFFIAVVKKSSRPISPEQALEWVEQISAQPCQPIDHRLVRIAIEQSARYRISYWDSNYLSKPWGATLSTRKISTMDRSMRGCAS
jgi:predicted nucleic acid-binding protein